jgi:tetratricopeptide (TPR) repeat protein
VMQTPIDFDGQGFTGGLNMTPAEKELEQRLRKEDESRFLKEIEKHRNWPRHDVKIFRAKLEQAQDLIGRKSVTSWAWTEASARTNIRNRNYEKAARIFTDHIAAAPNSPNLADAYIALIEVHLMQRDALKIRETFDKFYPLYEKNGVAIRQCGNTIASYYERLPGQSRYQVLFLAEKALRAATEASKGTPAHSQCLFDLANVLNYEEKTSDAIPLYQQSISTTTDVTVQDDRSLRLADALRRAGRLEESRALFTRLSTSERNSIREGAKAGLVYVAAAERAALKK